MGKTRSPWTERHSYRYRAAKAAKAAKVTKATKAARAVRLQTCMLVYFRVSCIFVNVSHMTCTVGEYRGPDRGNLSESIPTVATGLAQLGRFFGLLPETTGINQSI